MRRALADGARCRRAVSLRLLAALCLEVLVDAFDLAPLAAFDPEGFFAPVLLAPAALCAVVFFECSVELVPEVCPQDATPTIKAMASRLAASRTGAN
ncbi:MAG TPA: hypothetical protein VKR52_02135 [Terracidiphilus sp.]|nr:hypothetical protein [Terracidiphilus sp.]